MYLARMEIRLAMPAANAENTDTEYADNKMICRPRSAQQWPNHMNFVVAQVSQPRGAQHGGESDRRVQVTCSSSQLSSCPSIWSSLFIFSFFCASRFVPSYSLRGCVFCIEQEGVLKYPFGG